MSLTGAEPEESHNWLVCGFDALAGDGGKMSDSGFSHMSRLGAGLSTLSVLSV